MEKHENPFAVTKAVDFTDEQILDHWVALGGKGDENSVSSFHQMIAPTEPMNKIIIGSKGSGKTHILRYFSYKVQKIRAERDKQNNRLDSIKNEKYLGIYLRCSGLSSNRFKGKKINSEKWDALFKYYFELGLSQILLECVADTFELSDAKKRYISFDQEKRVARQIACLFDEALDADSFNGILDFIADEKKKIDIGVNNCIFTGDINFEIRLTPGHLLNRLPEILSDFFSDNGSSFMFMYIVDEFENLEDWQQQFVNTLYRDKSLECTYRIGTRLDGIKTMATFSANEENKEGAEFKWVLLDNELRTKNRVYKEFALNLILKRLNICGYGFDSIEDVKLIFGEQLSLMLTDKEQDSIRKKTNEQQRPWIKELKNLLLKNISTLDEVKSKSDIDLIIETITNDNDICKEKYNCFVLYQRWAKGDNLLIAAKEIVEKLKVDQHFKADMLAQIRRESNIKQVYCGVNTFIEMSCGIPRILLMLLKSIFDWSLYYDEYPFEKIKNGSVSLDIQRDAVRDTVKWFFNNAVPPSEDGKKIESAIQRLGNTFRGIRYSHKPSECELTAFSISGVIDDVTKRLLQAAVANSLLIEVKRRSKNGHDIEPMYQIHPIIAPKWDLCTTRRGSLRIAGKDIDMIFGDPNETEENFNQFHRRLIAKYTAPYFGKAANKESTKKQNQIDQSAGSLLFKEIK